MNAGIDRRSPPCGNRGPAWGLRSSSPGMVLLSARGAPNLRPPMARSNDHGHEIPALDLTKIDPERPSAIFRFSGPYR